MSVSKLIDRKITSGTAPSAISSAHSVRDRLTSTRTAIDRRTSSQVPSGTL